MSIYERVQKLIQEQGLTVKQLERECDLANATIRRWETQTPNIESVRRVAQRLHTSLDYLVNGSSPNANEEPLVCDGIPLNEAEADLIAMYRLLPEQHKEEVFDLVHFKYKRIVEDKKGSIYSTYTDENKQQKSDPTNGDNTKSGTA